MHGQMAGENPCDLWALSYLGCRCGFYLHHFLLPRAQKAKLLLRQGYWGKPWANSIFQGCSRPSPLAWATTRKKGL